MSSKKTSAIFFSGDSISPSSPNFQQIIKAGTWASPFNGVPSLGLHLPSSPHMDYILLEVTKRFDTSEDNLLQSPGDSPAHSQPFVLIEDPQPSGKQRPAIKNYLTNQTLTDGSGLPQLTHPCCTQVIYPPAMVWMQGKWKRTCIPLA